MQVAILTANARHHDAIGNQVAEKLAFFLDRGADVRVYVHDPVRLHPAVKAHCHEIETAAPGGLEWEYITSADLVVVEYGQDCLFFQLLPLLAEAKPRIVFCYYGITPPSLWGHHHRESLEKSLSQRGSAWYADIVLTTSRFARTELCDSTHLPNTRTRLLSLPVDVEAFTAGLPRECLKEKLRLDDSVMLLFVGRVAPNKRLPVLIDALPKLQKPGRAVHAVIVGDVGNVYQREMQRCLDRAAELGVADRLHFRGQLPTEELRDAYRSADVLVMPSLHEGFSVPVIEAMASGLPVVAARSSALPETLKSAGLTFAPDDAEDLAQEIEKVITPARNQMREPRPRRIAIVSLRYGEDFVGGAERSLRLMAETLHESGQRVEVFSSCVRREDRMVNELASGTTQINGVTVHRFPVDPHDSGRWHSIMRSMHDSDGKIGDEIGQEFIQHSAHSSALMTALWDRRDDFDAVIVGPFAHGLSADVAEAFGSRALLVPCFHDEMLARLPIWHEVYGNLGGMLYHSPEEQAFSEAILGFSVPGGGCIGTWIDMSNVGDPERGHRHVGGGRPYVAYAGRLIAEKGVQRLLDFASRYSDERPGKLTFVFMGQGNVVISQEPRAKDLGFVNEDVKRDVIAGAAVLLNLSPNESLSLAALEAWAEGVPVIGSRTCEVMVGHLWHGGGVAVDSYESFTATLDDLCEKPERWREMGLAGRKYVGTRFGSKQTFVHRLQKMIEELDQPPAERMKTRGLERAKQTSRQAWRRQFGLIIEELLDEPPSPYRELIVVEPRIEKRVVEIGTRMTLVPVRIVNGGDVPALHKGPVRHIIRATLPDHPSERSVETPLPSILVPGQTLSMAVAAPVPSSLGEHELSLHAVRSDRNDASTDSRHVTAVRIMVVPASQQPADGCLSAMLMDVQKSLCEAQRLHILPDDYVDVTQGRFASWKAWIKRKLLGNFKHAYVDVMSRRQSEFNRRVLAALQELAECCSTLESAIRANVENARHPVQSHPAESKPLPSHREFASSDRVGP